MRKSRESQLRQCIADTPPAIRRGRELCCYRCEVWGYECCAECPLIVCKDAYFITRFSEPDTIRQVMEESSLFNIKEESVIDRILRHIIEEGEREQKGKST